MNRHGYYGSLSADNATGDLFPTFEAFGVLGKRVGVEGATNANRGVRPLASPPAVAVKWTSVDTEKGWVKHVLGSKLTLFPYNRGGSSTQ